MARARFTQTLDGRNDFLFCGGEDDDDDGRWMKLNLTSELLKSPGIASGS